jgi:hypothetical protein
VLIAIKFNKKKFRKLREEILKKENEEKVNKEKDIENNNDIKSKENIIEIDNDDNDKEVIKEDKKEDKKEKEKLINIKSEENKKFLGTPKKQKKNLFEIPKDKISPKIMKKNDINNKINLESGINVKENISASSQRIEDNEDMQNVLKNLYISDVFLPNKTYQQPSLYNEQNIKNKYKRSKQIDFTLLVEIEGITNVNDEGFNITSRADETMSNLMKKVRLLIKKKYKIDKESNDFDIYLLKNEKQLPINDRQLIGDLIKNKDKIIISIIHKNSQIKEEEEEEDEEKENENQEDNNNNKKQNKKSELCPKDKLPILTKPGYYMIPNEYDIARMSIDEIKNVKNFTIYNENGKIIFDNPVSLYGVNFDNLFNIEHDLIEYEKGMWCHSPRGQNFNIPATIILHNIHPNIDFSNLFEKNKYIEFLKEKCRNNLNGTFVSYDDNSYQLKYKISYFY